LCRSFASDLDSKYFTALVSSLIKRNFYNDSNFPNSVLQSQLFAESKMAAKSACGASSGACSHACRCAGISDYITTCEEALSQAAHHDIEVAKLEEMLAGTDISKEHSDAFTRAWAAERSKVCARFVSPCIRR
jgi:hypothetical protein